MTRAPELRRLRVPADELLPVRLLVRELSRVPRLVLPPRVTLPRLPSFLFSPIPRSILPIAVVDLEILCFRVPHTELLGGEGPYPPRPRQLRDPNLQPLPFGLGPGEPLLETRNLAREPGGDRVQVNTPQHQQHRHYHDHREPPAPSGRLLPPCTGERPLRFDGPCNGPRRYRGPGPALRRGHQEASSPTFGASVVLIAALSRAEALRGFSSTSSSAGRRTAPLRKTGFAPHMQTGRSGGQTQRPSRSEMKRLTSRSSPEWKVMTTSRPPGTRSCSVAANARSSPPSSSLTCMRTAWKTLLAGLPPLSTQPSAPRTAW